VLLALQGCGGSSDDGQPAAAVGETTTAVVPAPDEPLELDELTETFVDTSRPTPAGAEVPARPERTLVTRIVHPAEGGPYPLIVMSHGVNGHPDEYRETLPTWAAEGFVVAAPAFPLSNRDVPGGPSNAVDVLDQPGDVSFVIDQVLALSADESSPLHGLVDPESVGVVGHSLGGATTWAVAYNTATRDERVDSAVVFAGLTIDMPGGTFDYGSGLPLLVLHGDADDVPIEMDHDAYLAATSPKWFVTLLGATHVPAFTDEPSPHDELVTRTVIDFWRGTLDGDAEALDRVTADATDPELSTVEHE
jgi:dienelactone hydrolase